jgi:hypothetical protein
MPGAIGAQKLGPEEFCLPPRPFGLLNKIASQPGPN